MARPAVSTAVSDSSCYRRRGMVREFQHEKCSRRCQSNLQIGNGEGNGDGSELTKHTVQYTASWPPRDRVLLRAAKNLIIKPRRKRCTASARIHVDITVRALSYATHDSSLPQVIPGHRGLNSCCLLRILSGSPEVSPIAVVLLHIANAQLAPGLTLHCLLGERARALSSQRPARPRPPPHNHESISTAAPAGPAAL